MANPLRAFNKFRPLVKLFKFYGRSSRRSLASGWHVSCAFAAIEMVQLQCVLWVHSSVSETTFDSWPLIDRPFNSLTTTCATAKKSHVRRSCWNQSVRIASQSRPSVMQRNQGPIERIRHTHIIARSTSWSSENYATEFEGEYAELTSCSVLHNILTVPLNNDICLLSSKISLIALSEAPPERRSCVCRTMTWVTNVPAWCLKWPLIEEQSIEATRYKDQ